MIWWSEGSFFGYDIFYDDEVGFYTVNDIIYFGIRFVELKEVMSDPCESESKDWYINHFKDIKGK